MTAAAYDNGSGGLQQWQTTAAAYDGSGSGLHRRLKGGGRREGRGAYAQAGKG